MVSWESRHSKVLWLMSFNIAPALSWGPFRLFGHMLCAVTNSPWPARDASKVSANCHLLYRNTDIIFSTPLLSCLKTANRDLGTGLDKTETGTYKVLVLNSIDSLGPRQLKVVWKTGTSVFILCLSVSFAKAEISHCPKLAVHFSSRK